MRNLVKEYIESGKTFADLQAEYGISYTERNNLICLSYSQIESPKTAEIVRQCRGIILDKNTLQIVHYPFYRFYNFDEVPTEHIKFNWNRVIGLEKIDGSLVGLSYHNNEWILSTRTTIGGFNYVGCGIMTFNEMFDRAIEISRDEFFSYLDKNIDYTFELCGPENQIVTPYDKAKLYLICARDKRDDFREIPVKIVSEQIYAQINDNSKEIFYLPKTFEVINDNKFIGFDNMKSLANNLPNATDDGFVVVDYSSYNSEFGYYPRVKVKNSSYIALHHLRGTFTDGKLNYGGILEIIFKGETDEVLANFPHFKQYFDEVTEKYNNFLNRFNMQYEAVKPFFDLPMEKRSLPGVKRDFALNIDKRYSTFLFPMFNKNMSFNEYIESAACLKKNYFKNFYEQFIA